ncbi:DegQ family serine endoprotease [Geobacter pelophilus]|uniref:Probable periplasmic serine endoprotease DegP-like n=1 Tax=Geoanaerobacter pelophilus TaxID=60036 RepID=A0AAW4L9G6_9BACT|nr:DegQ family serine endoprotease [Geoanaerobacter pelophilus]MBT0666495.1 DegQ family serine endoprotease [Geoanaerobacter pelophilus]
MKMRILQQFLNTSLISVFLILSLVAQGGCESRGKTEIIGFPQSFADLADKVKPAVVNIRTTSTVKVPGNPFKHFFGPDQGDQNDPFGDFFKRYFDDVPDKAMKQQSLGSGFIINKDGFIITNNHVVDNADEIKVKLSDGREYKAKVIGRDSKTDLALIKISSTFENLPVLALGDSDKMRVGDWVMAVGNPFGLEQTVTQGIISATGRVIGSGPYDNFLQTDAPINPGNSGGPLVNLKGEVIGINTAIVPGGQGIGFAIPSALAKSVTGQLKDKGKVVRGWIGVTIQTVTPELAQSFGMKETKGALVGDVASGGPAEKGGIKTGDIIVSFDGKNVKTSNDLPLLVSETPVGKTTPVTVIRENKEVKLSIKVEELTEEKIAAQSSAPVQSFGMKVDNITPQWRQQFGTTEKTGVLVVGVEQGSLADEAGIKRGDVIKEVNRKAVKNLADFNAVVAKRSEGQPTLFLLKRGKQTFFVTLESQ